MPETKAADVQVASKVMELISKAVVTGPSRDDILAEQLKKTAAEPKVYVVIPENDMIGGAHQGVTVNLQHYAPGKHYVAESIATEIMDRLKRKNDSDIALMSPKRDTRAVAYQAARGDANGALA